MRPKGANKRQPLQESKVQLKQRFGDIPGAPTGKENLVPGCVDNDDSGPWGKENGRPHRPAAQPHEIENNSGDIGCSNKAETHYQSLDKPVLSERKKLQINPCSS